MKHFRKKALKKTISGLSVLHDWFVNLNYYRRTRQEQAQDRVTFPKQELGYRFVCVKARTSGGAEKAAARLLRVRLHTNDTVRLFIDMSMSEGAIELPPDVWVTEALEVDSDEPMKYWNISAHYYVNSNGKSLDAADDHESIDICDYFVRARTGKGAVDIVIRDLSSTVASGSTVFISDPNINELTLGEATATNDEEDRPKKKKNKRH